MVRVATARRLDHQLCLDRDIKTSALAEDSSNLRLAEGCRNPENRVVSQLARLKWKSIPDGVPLRDM
jgi:hypothetical protein